MLLIITSVLAILPLLGVVWILIRGSLTTVDGLFMSLILLAISAIFSLNAYWEFQRLRRLAKVPHRMLQAGRRLSTVPGFEGDSWIRGRVQSVQFFEAHVGQPNKSIVVLSNGGSSRMLVLEGDLRNRLPAGKQVELTYREENGSKILLTADYS